MKLTWFGHSCFAAEEKGFKVIMDPYKPGSVPGLKPLRESADLVLCSHGHSDHNAAEQIALRTGGSNPFIVTQMESFHDDRRGALRGMNRILILKGEIKLVHMGDIGCSLRESQLELLRGADVLLIPVGGFYTIDAAQASAMADQIGARIVVPMHYRSSSFGYKEIGTLDAFTSLRSDTVFHDGPVLEIGPDTPAQTAVLRPLYG